MATRTLQEAESALRSGGLTGRSLEMALTSLRNSYATGATPAPVQTPGRDLNLSSGQSNTSFAAPAPDPYTTFNTELARMLTRAQGMGTKRFAEQGFNAQEEQNKRILQKTPGDLIGASPTLQSGVRSGRASALEPTISQASRAQQTFSEQIGGFKDAVEAARQFSSDIESRKEAERGKAAEIVQLAIAQGSTALSELLRTSPDIFKNAGYDTKAFEAVLTGLKKKEEREAYEFSVENAPKDSSSTPSEEYQTSKADNILVFIDSALDKVNGYTTGVIGASTKGIPGSPAYDLAKDIETIKANIGFLELQAMRSASPTGGALGQVAVQELQALQATLGNLDLGQSESQIRSNLQNIKARFTAISSRMNSGGSTGATQSGGTTDFRTKYGY